MKTVAVTLLAIILAGGSLMAGPAQDILTDLSDSARGDRMISGVTTLALGVGIGIGGYFLLSDLGLGSYAALAGGLIALPGLVTLVVPSEAELACARACDSEVNAALALEQMAANGKLARYISGIVNLAAGTASLLFPYTYLTPYDYVYSAVMSYGTALIDFLFPSKEERAYEQYLLLAGAGD